MKLILSSSAISILLSANISHIREPTGAKIGVPKGDRATGEKIGDSTDATVGLTVRLDRSWTHRQLLADLLDNYDTFHSECIEKPGKHLPMVGMLRLLYHYSPEQNHGGITHT